MSSTIVSVLVKLSRQRMTFLRVIRSEKSWLLSPGLWLRSFYMYLRRVRLCCDVSHIEHSDFILSMIKLFEAEPVARIPKASTPPNNIRYDFILRDTHHNYTLGAELHSEQNYTLGSRTTL